MTQSQIYNIKWTKQENTKGGHVDHVKRANDPYSRLWKKKTEKLMAGNKEDENL